MIDPRILRRDAEAAVAALPPLVAMAERRSRAQGPGFHGRRRPGQGGSFWQYRQAAPGDPFGTIDWRQSARARWPLVRENEWEAPQDIWVWADSAQSMRFRSKTAQAEKRGRAAVLALSLAILLVRGGERVSLADAPGLPPAIGTRQLDRLAERLALTDASDEYGVPPVGFGRGHGRAVLISDFLASTDAVLGRLLHVAGSVSHGCLLQVLDPIEEAFPYRGRIAFESVGGTLRHRSEAAEALAEDYKEALAARRAELRAFARRVGWQFSVHRTDSSASGPLVWLAGALRDSR